MLLVVRYIPRSGDSEWLVGGWIELVKQGLVQW